MRCSAFLLAVALVFLSGDVCLAQTPAADRTEIRGVVVDDSGKGVAGAIVTHINDPHTRPTASSNASGEFALAVDPKRATGVHLIASHSDGRQGFVLYFTPALEQPQARIVLGKTREIVATVVDTQKRPIAGATVGVTASYGLITQQHTNTAGKATLVVPAKIPLTNVYAVKAGAGLDYYLYWQPGEPQSDPYRLAHDHAQPLTFTLAGVRGVKIRVLDEQQHPLAGALVYPWYMELPKKGAEINTEWLKTTTNNEGIAEFDTIPANNTTTINFWAIKKGFVPAGSDRNSDRILWNPQSDVRELVGNMVPAAEKPEPAPARVKPSPPETPPPRAAQITWRGTVTLPDGKPAAGAAVSIAGAGRNSVRKQAKCDQEGVFEVLVDVDSYYVVSARLDRLVSPNEAFLVYAKKEPPPLSLKLMPATRVFGVLRMPKKRQPLADKNVQMTCSDFQRTYDHLPDEDRIPGLISLRPFVVQDTTTDAQGRFEFFTGPGHYYLRGDYSQHSATIELDGQEELEIDVEVDRPEKTLLAGKVVHLADRNRPINEATVQAVALENHPRRTDFKAVSNAKGVFHVNRVPVALLVYGQSEDGSLRNIVQLLADDDDIVIPLGPTAAAQGRLVDEDGKALPEQEIKYGVRIDFPGGSFTWAFGGTATTDAKGEFTVTGLAPGWDYQINVVTRRDADGTETGSMSVGWARPRAVEMSQLGDLVLKEFGPPTLDQIVERVLHPKTPDHIGKKVPISLAVRLKQKLRDAQLAEQQLLVLATSAKGDAGTRFLAAYYQRTPSPRTFIKAMAGYQILGVDVSEGEPLKHVRDMLAELKIPLPEDNDSATFSILDAEGKLVAATASTGFLADDHLDVEKLTGFLSDHVGALPDAEKLLADALAQTKREEKRVLVQVSGAFCAPCVLLSRYLDDHKELLAKDYVILKLDDRFVSGSETIKRVRTDANAGGIPWMVILDSTGKELITSTSKSGNIGFPSEPEGIEHFEKMLSATAQRLTGEEIGKLIEALVPQNKE